MKRCRMLVGCALAATGLGLGGCRPDPPPTDGGPSTTAPSGGTATPTVRLPTSRRCQQFCKIRGHCAYDAKLNACFARDDADCRASRGCRVTGLCTYAGGSCIGGKDEDCRASERCRDEGLCKYGPGAINVCMAASAEDCKASTACKRDGRCGLEGEFCRVSRTEDCRASTGCRDQGHCTLERIGRPPNQRTRCAAVSDDDCKGAQVCAADGKCTAVEGMCLKAGAGTPVTPGH